MGWRIKYEGSPESGGTIEKYRCPSCGMEAYATEFPRYFFDKDGKWHDPNFCPWCGSDNREEQPETWTRLDVIIRNLEILREQYEEVKDLPEDEKWNYWEDEYGSSLLYGIDCHVIFQGDPPCLLDERGLSIDPKDPKERWARDDACAECKAIWLMGKYE